ncbi:putative membrane protein [Mucilaginibacter gracilis]|uniref:Putative membrane protein n=1 Tax=Mucilaginibacter gracilis TaxID=423350 RepID=A0A495J7T3_9SPHI|nr:SRPBCC family protein [Mucilaginibacter gracilis]RKR84801.1 putative membrane protein [Mucilaginibacter gracilis]
MDFKTINLKLVPANAEQHPVNIELPERLASVALGTKMAFSGLFGVFRHPLRGAVKLFAGGYLLQRGVTGYCSLYAKIGKISTSPVNVNIRYTFTVNRSRTDVYNFWRRLENLPLFMSHLENVTVIDDTLSHWEAKIPGGLGNISWEAEIVNDVEAAVIGWHSLPGSTIQNAGKVEFEDAPGGGTIVKVVISYLPPAGGIGTGIAKLLNPLFEKIVRADVLSFKDYIETIYTDGDDFPLEPEITIITVETFDDEPESQFNSAEGNADEAKQKKV